MTARTGTAGLEPFDTIASVIARMHQAADELPPDDGLRAFNQMYLQVTERVGSLVSGRFFDDSAFLELLDVVFAHRYLRGTGLIAAPPAAPGPACWQVLLGRRAAHGTLGRPRPLQFALAGMNAHISHDLPLALVETAQRVGLTSLHEVRADFFRVNEVLEELEAAIRPEYVHDVLARLRAGAHVEDLLGCWSIVSSRAAAWENAEVLWHLRDHPSLRSAFSATLDAATASVCTILLTPLLPEVHAVPGCHIRLRRSHVPDPGSSATHQERAELASGPA